MSETLPVLDPQQLREMDTRETVRREMLDVPELSGQLCVWGLSCSDRLLVEQLVAGAGDNAQAKQEVRIAAWISMAVRESLEDDALQVWQGDVDPAQRKTILGFGGAIVDRIMEKSVELTGDPAQQEEILERIAGFIRAAGAPMLLCLARLCSLSAASEDCPQKSSGECPLENSPTSSE